MLRLHKGLSAVLRNDGTNRSSNENRYNQLDNIPQDNGYVAIACGQSHSVALKNDGTIWNQLDGVPIDGGYVAIACGHIHSVALKNDGTIKSWGDNDKNQLCVPTENNFMTDYSFQQFNYYQSLITNEFFQQQPTEQQTTQQLRQQLQQQQQQRQLQRQRQRQREEEEEEESEEEEEEYEEEEEQRRRI